MQETIRIADGAFEERLGYKFSAKELLERALTHSSAVPELRSAGAEEAVAAVLPRDNERLEFLGDAVLELLASEYLLGAFPEWSEGQLSKSRARIVNASSLEMAARRLRLVNTCGWDAVKRKPEVARNRHSWPTRLKQWWLRFTWMADW